MLTDWTDKKREWVFEELKKQSDSYNFHQRTVGDFLRDVRNRELSRTIADKKAWGEMRTNATDLADVPGCTYLMNGAALAGNWTGLFRPGERVQLRFINGSGITYFDVRMSSSWATPQSDRTWLPCRRDSAHRVPLADRSRDVLSTRTLAVLCCQSYETDHQETPKVYWADTGLALHLAGGGEP